MVSPAQFRKLALALPEVAAHSGARARPTPK
jgi:hypothetical protein